MQKSVKIKKCQNFFKELSNVLSETHDSIGSCNNDISMYLIPKGSESELSYYGKPEYSFRISDHWNWYSSSKKCSDLKVIQCNSVDIPWCRKREETDKATKPIYGIQVSYYGKDHKYHHVFGEKFNRKTKKWVWVENDVDTAVNVMKGDLYAGN